MNINAIKEITKEIEGYEMEKFFLLRNIEECYAVKEFYDGDDIDNINGWRSTLKNIIKNELYTLEAYQEGI